MGTLLIAATLLPGLCGEKVTVGNGFGWDGQIYGRLAQRFYYEVVEMPISSYRVQRMLPSALVHLGLRLTAHTRDNTSVIQGFVLLNVLMLVCALALWERIAHSMGISLPGCWLGFVGLFVNFAVLKQASYYPVLTDLSAFTLGLLVFFAYLRDRPVLLCAATLAGGFTWPVAAYAGMLMFKADPVFLDTEMRKSHVQGDPINGKRSEAKEDCAGRDGGSP